MAVYFLLFILLMFASYASKRVCITSVYGTRQQDKIFLVISTVLLSVVEGLRAYSVGTDTRDYAKSFALLDYKYETYEYFSKLLVDVVHAFSAHPSVYLMVCAFIINGLVLLAAYRTSVNVRYSVFIFVSLLFYFTSYNAMRQAMAFALVLNAFCYICEKKIIRCLIFILVATLFHSSALMGLLYLIIPFVSWIKKKKAAFDNDEKSLFETMYKIFLICGILGVSVIAYTNFDKMLLSMSSIFPMYEVYLYNEFRDLVGGIQQPVVYTLILVCFVFLVPNNSKYKDYYIVPLALSVIFAFASMKMAYIARFMYYFDITTILSIPYMLEHNRFTDMSKNLLFKCAVIVACIAFLFYGLLNNYMRVTNYNFFWQM